MAVDAENMCFESMAAFGSGFGIHDGSYLQELQPVVGSDSGLVGSLPVEIVRSLFSDLEKQRKELDLFLQWENKRLRKSILQESRRQQGIILQKYETLIRALMLQKDEELAIARNRARELQDLSTAAEMEAKAWEQRAKEKEAIVTDLNKKINSFPYLEDDAVSFCGSSSGQGREEHRLQSHRMACKLCQARSLCVVFLPCRHLCCCKYCDSLLGHCPVCQTVKEASLEVALGSEEE